VAALAEEAYAEWSTQPDQAKGSINELPRATVRDDDFDVLADGAVVGRIFKANASPVGASWMWTLAFGHDEDRMSTQGYEATREAALAVR
jgi:hypothetical protein